MGVGRGSTTLALAGCCCPALTAHRSTTSFRLVLYRIAMRGSKSALHLDMGASLASLPDREELPPLAALFLIYFDTKAGYR